MLLEMIKKREKLKRDHIQITLVLFELRAVIFSFKNGLDEEEWKSEDKGITCSLPLLQKEGAMLPDYSYEREPLKGEREKWSSSPAKPAELRKRRRRDSALALSLSQSSASSSTSTSPSSSLISIGREGGRRPSKRPKTVVKLTSGHVYAHFLSFILGTLLIFRHVAREQVPSRFQAN